MPNPNAGHGHVFPRPDGVKARCGGPGLCAECSGDLAHSQKIGKAVATIVSTADYLLGRCIPFLDILRDNEEAKLLRKDIVAYALGTGEKP